jgi:transposase
MDWKRGRAYAQDLRDRVFAASDAGAAVGRIADGLFVSVSYVSKALGRRRLTGETTARPQRCHVPPKLLDYHEAIREQVGSRPDWTLEELRVWLLQTHNVSASTTLIWETLAQLDLTLKKDPARGGAEPTGRCQGTRGMARQPAQPEPRTTDLHR